MAVKRIKCVFNDVNGENTGVYCRSGKTSSSKSLGILIKKNCKDGTFYVDGNDSGNSYYRLIDPQNYGLPNTKMYAYCGKEYLQSMVWPSSTQTSTNTTNTKNTTQNTSNATYSNGLDAQITAMLQANKSLNDVMDNIRIIGAPYQFLKSTDYRPFTEKKIGRKYMENILAEAPIVNFVPGIPNYLGDFDAVNKELIENYLSTRYEENDISDSVLKKITGTSGRYFNFISNYTDYMRYVNLLCRVCSMYVGLGEKNVPGTTEKYKNYDWSRYTNLKSAPKKSEKKQGIWENIKDGVEDIFDNISDEIFGDYRYVKCYVDPSSSFSESINNSTTSSQLAGLYDTAEGLVKDIAFLTSSNGSSALDSVGSAVSSGINSLASSFDKDSTSNIKRLLGMAEHVITGSNIIFPEIWSDSKFDKSYSFTINLISPYGDVESIFLNIIMPLMHLIALGLPRQTSANSFTSPFLVKVFSKGWFSCEMGMVSGISISKGGSGDWNVHGLPTVVKVDISVTDLYSNLMMTKSSKPQLFVNNQGLIEFLAVACGVDITKPDITTKIETIISTFLSSLYDIPSSTYNAFIESIRNKIEPFFKITN